MVSGKLLQRPFGELAAILPLLRQRLLEKLPQSLQRLPLQKVQRDASEDDGEGDKRQASRGYSYPSRAAYWKQWAYDIPHT
ncbi:hypothetical protein cyc_09096 [Cyclospora cayetanensis]|uniref:Uncharacterized protein n=1 Tax=Cyclospora cayetanensis TaxID=88456 RepID=A0A1D3D576_9EIME|nr:hypothetical protein cyc_09096 [Cyclospora cayetanensis]